jgi:integrase
MGCALRRAELAALNMEDIQQREGRWVIADLCGKGGRIRTVAIPMWVQFLMDTWTSAAGHTAGRLLRPVSKKGRLVGEELSDWAVWSVVEISAKTIGIERFGAHDLRRTCAKLCRKNGGDLEQIKFLLGHASIQTLALSRRLPSPPTTTWGFDAGQNSLFADLVRITLIALK